MAEEKAVAALFHQLQDVSKAICMVVSDARCTTFSQRNLSKLHGHRLLADCCCLLSLVPVCFDVPDAITCMCGARYLSQRGLKPSGNLLHDAAVLLSLVRDEAAKKALGSGRSSTFAHELKKAAVSPQHLAQLFPDIKARYVQQPLDYGRNSRYGDKWRISCYMVVMDNWKPKIMPHEPMLQCLGDVMTDCVRMFEEWYCTLKGYRPGSKQFDVMNAFVTRYRAVHGEDELQKHIETWQPSS